MHIVLYGVRKSMTFLKAQKWFFSFFLWYQENLLSVTLTVTFERQKRKCIIIATYFYDVPLLCSS